MTIQDFRKLALSLPETCEREHMGHPDFRVSGKIFATVPWPDRNQGMVKLSPEHQKLLVESQPAAFERAQGAWGLHGATYVRLEAVDEATLRGALLAAWRNRAAKRLLAKLPEAG